MDEHTFYTFLEDKHVIELQELLKTSDDILDVITLTENQHSHMLAWCLNPNEGHGQRDAIIKDFLTAAYYASAEHKYDNKKFFHVWTPGVIHQASFGSLFVCREFNIVDLHEKRRRLDLLLIDPHNKFIVTIENKAGSTPDVDQLNDYHAAVKNALTRNACFHAYKFLFVAIDKWFNPSADNAFVSQANRWAFMNYQWLDKAAYRARLQSENHHAAVQLLLSYCQKQTDWQSPVEQKISELSATLAIRYAPLVEHFYRQKDQSPVQWRASTFTGIDAEILLFLQQHRPLCDKLIQSRGIAGVLVNMKKALPDLQGDDGSYNLQISRTWFNFVTDAMLEISAETYWPIYVNIFREKGENARHRFGLRVFYAEAYLNEAFSSPHSAFTDLLYQHFPAGRTSRAYDWKTLSHQYGLSATEVVEQAKRLAQKIDAIIQQGNEAA
ncbi:PD-(D/E)XK nuclease family protein [Dickeya dadantii]|uniref:PDDEXK-like family protein n=1 Tax=Dickeya dadantii TaxID=204038 RepID=UPI001CF2796E|nr:PD-(D/E)XK nuclease family protein [Dickeya dadantii]MCA7014353.1 PD-(D/E)XK nuclease family protein [Dickeya dadantii]